MVVEILEEFSGDIALKAKSNSIEKLFEEIGKKVQEIQFGNIGKGSFKLVFEVEDKNLDILLFKFINEILFLKDSKHVIFTNFKIKIKKNDRYKLICRAKTETISKKHKRFIDIKAATMHKLCIKRHGSIWIAFIVMDV